MITISTQKVKADSGFDTSYDSGGSSWDSSSSSDWDSGNYSSSGGGSFIGLIIFTVIFIIAIKSALDKSKSTNVHPSIVDSSLSDDEIRKYIPNFDRNKFITDRFNDYVQIQNAWMNFDYNTLRSKLTDELYNQYAMQLDTMKVKNTYIMLMKSITENNIDKVKYKLSDELYNKILEEMKYYDMKALAQVYDEIKIKNAYIIDTSENNNEFKILVLLDVKYKFYTVNKKTKKPNFLSYNKKVENKYTWYFQRKLMLKKIAYHQNVKVVEQT